MRRGVPVVLVLVASLVLAPTAALARRPHGGSGGHRGFAGRHLGGSHFGGKHFHGKPFHGHIQFGGSDFFSDRHHRFGHRGFGKSFFHAPIVPFAAISSPVVVYAPPPVVYGPTVIVESPVAPALPVAYPPVATRVSVAPAPEPMPRVVEHPTGRYELRGDGVATAYTWVWIPNPPSAPPAPEVAAPAAQSPSGARLPARRTQVYRWTDAEGVEHWTDRRDLVPEQHRPPARRQGAPQEGVPGIRAAGEGVFGQGAGEPDPVGPRPGPDMRRAEREPPAVR
jgi:hypothetical protein